jgi:hypothetical protein
VEENFDRFGASIDSGGPWLKHRKWSMTFEEGRDMVLADSSDIHINSTRFFKALTCLFEIAIRASSLRGNLGDYR